MSLHLPEPDLSPIVREFEADFNSVSHRRRLSRSPMRLEWHKRIVQDWKDRLEGLTWEGLTRSARIDALLLQWHLQRTGHVLDRSLAEAASLGDRVPFASAVCELEEGRESMVRSEPQRAARLLDDIARLADAAPSSSDDAPALDWGRELQSALTLWKDNTVEFDPELFWWTREPLDRAEAALSAWVERNEEAASAGSAIPGRPMGREALEQDLADELISNTPEELIAIGDREYAWCLDQMKQASRDLGHGDDWRSAVEAVKDTALAPGLQPAKIAELAREAVDWLEARDLVTIPSLAKESWRMDMMAAERQKVSPFFLGGDTIIVSYPASTMTPQEKSMSMRGNNLNFSRATVQHELIPGHHLQFHMCERRRQHRSLFTTPFWIEGWTLYWELLLWNLGFPRTPEERIGMLFWRMHRCARISFSLRYHLGQLSTADCVDILVDQVGHERANAEGEVRRSFNGTYPPLYQAAYMIGGLQFMAMQKELTGSGQLSLKGFHDGVMAENQMPPSILRLTLGGGEPVKGLLPVWRFPPA